MVQANPQLLIPLHMIIVMLFIIVFALLKKYETENRNWFMLGMFFGSITYAMLVLSSTIKESSSLWEYLLKFLAAGFAGTYYIVILLFSAIISLMILVKDNSIMYENEQEKLHRIINNLTEEKARELGISRRTYFDWKKKIRERKPVVLKNKLMTRLFFIYS